MKKQKVLSPVINFLKIVFAVIGGLVVAIVAFAVISSRNSGKKDVSQKPEPVSQNQKSKEFKSQLTPTTSNVAPEPTKKTTIALASPSLPSPTPSPAKTKKPTPTSTKTITTTSTPISDFSNAEEIINDHCQNEWPDDFRMQNYCIDQQNEGLASLKRGKPSDIQDTEFSIIRTGCESEWPDDFKMRAYCEKQQYEGVRTLNQGKPADISEGDFNTIRTKCSREWPRDFKMRAYCERQQYEAIRNLR